MAKRFYDTGLPDQLWYQNLKPKCKALFLHLLCKCDVAGTFEVNYPLFSAYIGEQITEEDVFSFGRRVVPLMNHKDKGIIVDFIYFQCGGELNVNVKAHRAILKRLTELGLSTDDIINMGTHELKVYSGEAKNKIEKETETPVESVEATVVKRETVKRVKEKSSTIQELFSQFYSAYPRHDSKQIAMLKFAKIMSECKTEEDQKNMLDKMLKSIETSKSSEQWNKENGKYIPMPSTWLNQRRWEDEGVVITRSNTVNSELSKAFVKALQI